MKREEYMRREEERGIDLYIDDNKGIERKIKTESGGIMKREQE
jgi:hypothetical protein